MNEEFRRRTCRQALSIFNSELLTESQLWAKVNLDRLRAICENFSSKIFNHQAQPIHDKPEILTSTMSIIQRYPPVLGPSLKQEKLWLFGGEKTNPSEYATLHFSDEFKSIYGTPTLWWRAWYRLMTISVNQQVLPNLPHSFIWVERHISFLDYCKDSDSLACRKWLPVLTRRELEGAWAQALVYKFDNEKEEDMRNLIDSPSIRWVKTMEDVRTWMRYNLQRAIKKVRFLAILAIFMLPSD